MGHFITLKQAIQMTTVFRNNKGNVLSDSFRNKDILCNAETFDRAAFDTVLAQQGYEKIRIYYGMDEESKVHAIIVGVNANNQDILPGSQLALATEETVAIATEFGETITTEEDTGIIVAGVRCPLFSMVNRLNEADKARNRGTHA